MRHNLLYIVLISLLFPLAVSAQVGPGVPGGNTTIRTTPRYPAPNSEVRLIFTSYEGDEHSALISWFQNGTLIKQGRGLTEITITSPKAGERAEIVANADLTNGRVIAAEYVLAPTTVTIIPQAGTYTPPFYSGKAIPTVGSDTHLIAIPEFFNPDGSLVDPDTLSYEWWSDGGQLEKTNRNIAVLKNPIFIRTIRVLVTVNGPRGQFAESSITIPARRPSLVLYTSNPVQGVWYNNAVPPAFQMRSTEIEVRAEPYFFAKSVVPSLSYDWGLPGSAAPFRSAGSTLVLRPEEGVSGRSLIHLTARQVAKSAQSLFQDAKTSFLVAYEGSGESQNRNEQSSGNTNSSFLPNF